MTQKRRLIREWDLPHHRIRNARNFTALQTLVHSGSVAIMRNESEIFELLDKSFAKVLRRTLDFATPCWLYWFFN